MTGTGTRPLGVSILSILILLTGLGLGIRGVFGLLNGGEGPAGIVVAFVLLVVGVVYLLVAKGIWNGNRGSRLIVSVLTLIALVGSLATLTTPGETAVSIVQIIISLVILLLLFGRKARAHFG